MSVISELFHHNIHNTCSMVAVEIGTKVSNKYKLQDTSFAFAHIFVSRHSLCVEFPFFTKLISSSYSQKNLNRFINKCCLGMVTLKMSIFYNACYLFDYLKLCTRNPF